MRRMLSKIKDSLYGSMDDEDIESGEDEYVELDALTSEDSKSKLVVKPFTLEDFSDVKPVLDALREGYTISLINIKPLKDKDLIELKRAINKIKKTCDATEGNIAGFGDDWIVVTPHFVDIKKSSQTQQIKED